ncbi:hypothetical protein [Lactobacillus sp.]|uniref:hypothetical protein n=1 Tax=Lactobacillus sp. TaxID=1591 RepID=UPI0019AE089A|nr:hypothetical protein [Lactobacillus sp.]MBD5430095.1 hypothetical protein [Lactobacillus sp.]MBD5430575.1 hypothetical protein [Lactobacillus sp.]
MLRKLNSWVIKVIAVVGVLIAGLLTINGTVTMSSSTSGLVNSVLNKAAAQSGNSNVETGVQLFQALGLDNAVLNQLPKKIEIKTSLSSFNDTTKSFQQTGQIETSDLGLKNNTDQEKTINDLLIKLINNQLAQNKKQISQYAQYYRMAYYAILLLYIVTIILILTNSRGAIIPLLIASVGSYELLQSGSIQAMDILHQSIYSGIKITLGGEFITSITIAIIISILWLFLAKIGKKKKTKIQPSSKKKYKHAA